MKIARMNIATASLLISAQALAAGNSSPSNVVSIEMRDSGYHAVYISEAVPAEGCLLQDRAIIVDETNGNKAGLATVLGALMGSRKVVVRVDGCVPIDPGQSLTVTAPRVIKVQVY